jgi:dolichyl-phosphate beta-glucosyltransferase
MVPPVPPAPALSVVIPAFNEALRLPPSLQTLKAYLDTFGAPVEVLVVDDGSSDDTGAVVRAWMRTWPSVRLIAQPHRGKGAAVRAGMLEARGDYVALADADFAMPAAEFARFMPALREGCDIAIGSREVPGAQRFDEPVYRHLMGRVFNRLVQLLLLPGIEDTQCGFKLFQREAAADLCQRQTIDGWGFDVELLVIARLRGYRIREIPIPWHCMPGSRVRPVRDTIAMVAELLRIRANARRGQYGGIAGAEAPGVAAPLAVVPVAPVAPDAAPALEAPPSHVSPRTRAEM